MVPVIVAGVVAVALAAAVPGNPGVQPVEEGWRRVVAAQLERYPEMQAEDVYKLAHQATFGPAHLITDEAAARRYLLAELGGVAADPAPPLVEPLADNPRLVRVNLRPFKAAGGDPEVLLRALVATAASVSGEAAAMRGRLDVALEVLRERGRPAEAERLRVLGAALEARGFPAAHHSEAYTRSYRPAYRVVRSDLLPNL
ncbi:MAG: hypothetical protein MUF10_04785 [Thermoanaerobaculaceae bacterium]|jgi:hypothetical protein|nr:hypothetical protein [Thermoanaerobaculaceae bacterium]